jgi:hypothetical protein
MRWEDVKPMLEKYLDDRFIVVNPPAGHTEAIESKLPPLDPTIPLKRRPGNLGVPVMDDAPQAAPNWRTLRPQPMPTPNQAAANATTVWGRIVAAEQRDAAAARARWNHAYGEPFAAIRLEPVRVTYPMLHGNGTVTVGDADVTAAARAQGGYNNFVANYGQQEARLAAQVADLNRLLEGREATTTNV